MKIPKFLKDRTGKLPLPALRAAVLAGAVGVAGVAAWQLFGSGAPEDEIVLSPAEQEEVVLMASGPGASASGGVEYGEGGEVQSAVRARLSKDMELMQTDIRRAQIPPEPEVVRQEEQVSAYQMDGAAEGLGMGKNAAHEWGASGGGDMSAVQRQIAALQSSFAAKQKEAQPAPGDAAAKAALMKAGGASSGAFGGGRGSGLNSAPLQSYGQEGQNLRASRSGVNAPNGNLPDMLAGAGRPARFEGGRQASSGIGKNLNARDTLSSMQKQSVDIAGSRTRSANEGTRAFMAGEKLSGGIRLEGENVNTGQSSSSDFKDNSASQLGGWNAAMDDVQSESEQYEEARKKLRGKLWAFIASAAAVTLMGFLKWTPWTWGAWAVAVAGLITGYVFLQRAINAFKREWRDKAYKGQYEKGGYHNKATTVAATALGMGIAGGIVSFTLVVGTLLLINWNAPSWKEPDPAQQEQVSPSSPYGADVADDALYLDENINKPEK